MTSAPAEHKPKLFPLFKKKPMKNSKMERFKDQSIHDSKTVTPYPLLSKKTIATVLLIPDVKVLTKVTRNLLYQCLDKRLLLFKKMVAS